MKIAQYTLGALMTNCYILSDEQEAVIIDAAEYDQRMISYINENNLKVKIILLTHGHFDHVSGAAQLSETLKAPLAIGKRDENMYYDNEINGVSTFGRRAFNTKKIEFLLSEGDKIEFGNYQLEVIETPGHSEGGLSFYTKGYLFSGDTLFRESIGRSDFYGGDHNALIQSIKNKLYLLEDSTIVYPGHGQSSTIGYEKKHNFYTGEYNQ